MPGPYIDTSRTGRRVDGTLTFFDDPAIDKLFGVVLALARENYVLSDRVRVLEHLLGERGLISEEEIERFAPTGDLETRFRDEREAYFDRLLEPLTPDDLASHHIEGRA